jgi:Flp pilus assembly protein TadB
MSKINIGVGDEFPLDEGPPREDRHAWKEDYRAQRRFMRRHHHAHRNHHGHGHHYHHRGLLHLPLLIAVAAVAALIGAGKISTLATNVILGVAVFAVLLAVLAHWRLHRQHHRNGQES